MKLYYFYTLKSLWDGQVKIKMYYGISWVKKQLSGKRSILTWWHESRIQNEYFENNLCPLEQGIT